MHKRREKCGQLASVPNTKYRMTKRRVHKKHGRKQNQENQELKEELDQETTVSQIQILNFKITKNNIIQKKTKKTEEFDFLRKEFEMKRLKFEAMNECVDETLDLFKSL